MMTERVRELRPEAYRAYLAVLAKALLRTSGPLQNKVAASDVVQETLMQAHTRFGQFEGTTEEELAAWLRAILANKLTDAARHFGRQKRDAGLEQSYRETIEQSAVRLQRILPADQTSPSQHIARHQRICRLVEALGVLSEPQREVVEMHHLMGYTVAEIAERMERSRAGVAGLLRRGLKRLREVLDAASVG